MPIHPNHSSPKPIGFTRMPVEIGRYLGMMNVAADRWDFDAPKMWKGYLRHISGERLAALNVWAGDILVHVMPGYMLISFSEEDEITILFEEHNGAAIGLVYASSENTPVKFMLYQKQINDALIHHSNTLKVNRFEAANEFRSLQEIITTKTDEFKSWESGIDQNDRLLAILREKYGSEHNDLMSGLRAGIVSCFARVAKDYGCRYFSISAGFLCCFENVRFIKYGAKRGSLTLEPMAMSLADMFGLDFNRVESGAQIYLPCMGKDGGVYDLTGEKPVRIADAISMGAANFSQIERRRDKNLSTKEWMQRCASPEIA
jgi:hypothetical protein